MSKWTVALDVTETKAVQLIEQLTGICPGVKIGLTLFTEAGQNVVSRAVNSGYEVFLDLKLHDIPHQVGGAVKRACDLGIHTLTVHTCGGNGMMEAAARAAEGYAVNVVGVTVLTSLDRADLESIGCRGPLEAVVEMRAQMAHEAGLAGVVCSANELRLLRDEFPSPFLLVTPGIRLSAETHGDQKRVATPNSALKMGADLLVVGRPITQAPDPIVAAEQFGKAITAEGPS